MTLRSFFRSDLVSLMRQAGSDVDVVMTVHATRFITPLTMRTLSRRPVHVDQFDPDHWEPEHTALADDADLFIVVPATANAVATTVAVA